MRLRYGISVFGVICSVLSFSIVAAPDASAANCGTSVGVAYEKTRSQLNDCTNIAPQEFLDEIDDDIATRAVTYVTWVSPRDSPHLNSITVDPGTTSIQLQMNILAYRKSSNTRTHVKRHYIDNSSNPVNLRGKTIQTAYPPSGHYQIGAPLRFSYTIPAAYFDRTFIIGTAYKGVQIATNGTFPCVVSGSTSVYTTSLDNPGPCERFERDITIRIKVRTKWDTWAESRIVYRVPGGQQVVGPWRPGHNTGTTVYTQSIPAGSVVRWQYRLRLDGTSRGQNFIIKPTSERRVTPSDGAPGFINPAQPLAASEITVNSNAAWIYNTWLGGSVFNGGYGSTNFQTTSAMGGSLLCERLLWSPRLSNGGTPTSSRYTAYNNCVRITIPAWQSEGATTVERDGQPGTNTTTDLGVSPGEVVRYRHYLGNTSVNKSHVSVSWRAQHGISRTPSPWTNVPGASGSRILETGVNVNANPRQGQVNSTGYAFTIPANPLPAPGTLYCRQLAWSPASSTNNGSMNSNAACARVVYNPDLNPHISGPTGIIIPGAATINVKGDIVNSGTANEHDTRAGVARFVVKRGGSLSRTGPGEATTSPAGGFACRIVQGSIAPAAQQCAIVGEERTYGFGEIIDTRNLWNGPDSLAGLNVEVGDKVCYVTVVNKYLRTVTDNDWRHSQVACVTVAIIPKAQISGGDVLVRKYPALSPSLTRNKVVRGSSYVADGKRFGSWAEYSIFGPEAVDMYSAGAIARGGCVGCAKNNLTFANDNESSPGYFDVPGEQTIPNLETFAVTSTLNKNGSNTFGIGTDSGFNTSDRIYKFTGGATTQTIEGGSISSGTYVLDNRSGTVKINGDIRYAAGPHGNLSNLPQLIIVAKDIEISPDVEHVDAWLIAGGVIRTCDGGPSGNSPTPYYQDLNSEKCNKKLRINGIVQADRLFLRRTAAFRDSSPGTPEQLNSPSEVLNARSDAYLWAYGRAASQGVVRTESVSELPPRF